MKTSILNSFRENGRKIAIIRDYLAELIQTQPKLEEIEKEAVDRIKKAGGTPAFQRVPGYKWATCISVNDCIVHGIPEGSVKTGDLVTIDIGMFYKNTTTDTATTVIIGKASKDKLDFLKAGREAVDSAIKQAVSGNKVIDISRAMQETIESSGFNVSRQLIGHGLGETIHEDPPIPCYVSQDPKIHTKIKPGMVLAIEVMYMMGEWPCYTSDNGWGMYTQDGSLAAQFEHDIIITTGEPEIITA